jgi:hypothetical protein
VIAGTDIKKSKSHKQQQRSNKQETMLTSVSSERISPQVVNGKTTSDNFPVDTPAVSHHIAMSGSNAAPEVTVSNATDDEQPAAITVGN